MNKLVCGVGVNDLGYRVHVREWVTYGKTPTTGRQHVKVVDAPSMQGVWVYDFPSDSAVFVHRENITHLKAAVSLAEPLLGL